jgi:hypothetical protein
MDLPHGTDNKGHKENPTNHFQQLKPVCVHRSGKGTRRLIMMIIMANP